MISWNLLNKAFLYEWMLASGHVNQLVVAPKASSFQESNHQAPIL